jgi:hypothetical protein
VRAPQFQLYYAWETCRAIERFWSGKGDEVGAVQHRLLPRPVAKPSQPPAAVVDRSKKGKAKIPSVLPEISVVAAPSPLDRSDSSGSRISERRLISRGSSSSLTTMASGSSDVIAHDLLAGDKYDRVKKRRRSSASTRSPVLGAKFHDVLASPKRSRRPVRAAHWRWTTYE